MLFFKKGTSSKKGIYKDRYFRIVLSIIAAHIIVLYYDQDSLFEAIFTLSYLNGFIGSLVIALMLTEYIHYITVRLDEKYDWHTATLMRLLWQTLLGFAAPGIAAFLLAALFFYLSGYNIFETVYLQQDYTLVLFMLLVLNIYYFGLNSFLKYKAPATQLASGAIGNKTENNPEKENTLENTTETLQPSKKIIIIDTPTKSIPIPVENITYCYILGGFVFIRTLEMTSLQDSYQISQNLRTLEEQLDKSLFFRINRQMIVNFSACRYFRAGKNKTLEIILDPLPYPEGSTVPVEHQRLCIVSEDRVNAFKQWMYH